MDDIGELERRLAAALERIDAGLDGAIAGGGAGHAGTATQLAELQEALEAERANNARLTMRVTALEDRRTGAVADLEQQLDRATKQLDAQALEVQRLKTVNDGLRAAIGPLQEAQAATAADPHLINKAMQAELEALRAARAAEIAEMDEILTELAPLVEEQGDA